ncbi:MAG: methionine adenosyltransferase [Defluviitaleaceae bacterium]|nr:methionine adenosyltransferase [Defluviitaleaceae bacterium]
MYKIFTSESVTEGHPDKICDAISDRILDAMLEKDPESRVACDVLVTTGLVLVAGEVTTKCYVDIESLVRDTIKDIGYTGIDSGFDYNTCAVLVSLKAQSPDIAMGVDAGDILDTGAGDQGMMFGFATDETEELMPLPISLSHKITMELAKLRKDGTLSYLRPDGKSQVSVEYSEEGKPKRISAIVVSTQHSEGVSTSQIYKDVREHIINKVVPCKFLDEDTKYYINPTGRFVIGGPASDSGQTGRKIIVDTYGGYARHGGGAFSGKDATKVDRSGAYMARYVAKNVVAAGLASRCEIEVAYAIGVSYPVSLSVTSLGTSTYSDEELTEAVKKVFDLRPGAIIKNLNLKKPIYSTTSAYGHFGKKDLPWEKTDKIEELKKAIKQS